MYMHHISCNFIHKVQQISIYLILFTINNIIAKNQECVIKLPQDIPPDEPLYLIKHGRKYDFLHLTNATNYIASNGKLTLLCPGRRNHIVNQIPNTNRTDINCKSSTFKDINNISIRIHQLNCTKTVQSNIQITNEKCSNNRGYIHEIGFHLTELNKFLTVFKVCYSNKTDTTFFSVHQINGAAIKYAVKDNRRRSFITTGTSNEVNMNHIYKKQYQLQHFQKLLGNEQTYFTSTMYLARGHLTPDADFILPNFQLSTYYYINVAPEFQIINAGNWLRVENLVRSLAIDYGDDFLIYTGVYEQLILKNYEKNVDIPLYLDTNKKVEIPKWFWKCIKNLKTNSGIVFITLNNPFAKIDEIHEFCPNVCKNAELFATNFNDIRKGYTFCCEINDFKKIVHDLPSNFISNSLLNCTRINANLIL